LASEELIYSNRKFRNLLQPKKHGVLFQPFFFGRTFWAPLFGPCFFSPAFWAPLFRSFFFGPTFSAFVSARTACTQLTSFVAKSPFLTLQNQLPIPRPTPSLINSTHNVFCPSPSTSFYHSNSLFLEASRSLQKFTLVNY
jgi:hypothetical protein